jgi:hypothetical protein
VQLKEHGGVEGLCKKLATNGRDGLPLGDEGDVAQRKKVFGANVIPSKKSKSFLELAWEAIQDTTLIILMICAIISIGLSFYDPGMEPISML